MAPDKDWTDPLTYYSRLRVELWLQRGDVDAFRIQLEYDHSHQPPTQDWAAVARFDHTPNSPTGHDITEEGLHLDLCTQGDVVKRKRGFPSVPVNKAPDWCDRYLRDEHDRLISDYERRSNVPPEKRRLP